MIRVQLNRMYYRGKLCWAIYPDGTTTVELYKTKTAVPLGTFTTKKLALAFCEAHHYKVVACGTRLVP